MNTNQHTPVNSSATVANNYLARSLRQLQSTTFLHCMEHSRKTINTSPPVYTGMTALRLAGIETPLCSRFEAVKFQVLYVGEPTKRSGRKDTSYLKCPPSLNGHRPPHMDSRQHHHRLHAPADDMGTAGAVSHANRGNRSGGCHTARVISSMTVANISRFR